MQVGLQILSTVIIINSIKSPQGIIKLFFHLNSIEASKNLLQDKLHSIYKLLSFHKSEHIFMG